MFVRCLCLLATLQLLLSRTAAVPIPRPVDNPMKKLYSPHLWVNGAPMPLDIVTYLRRVVKCPFDIVLDNLYGDAAVDFFPYELKHSTSSAYVDVYNGNINLLSAIYQRGWLKEMCAEKIIADLTSIQYCSMLEAEKSLVKQLVIVLSGRFSNASLTETITKLANLKEGKECDEMCGKPYKNAMCNGVIEMTTFLMDQMFAETQETVTPETGTSSAQSLSSSPSPVVTGNSMTNGNHSNTADSPVAVAKAPPPPAQKTVAIKNEPTGATSIPQDVLHGALVQYLRENPDFLQTMLAPVFDNKGLLVDGESFVNEPDDTDKPTDTADTDEPTDTDDTDEPTDTDDAGEPTDTDDAGEPTDTDDAGEPTDTNDTGEPTDTDDTGEPTDTDDTGEHTDTDDTGEHTKPDDPKNPATPQQSGPDDGAFDPNAQLQSDNAGDGETLLGSDDEEPGGSSGYSSFHFFGIFLVLAIFAVVTYLCVFNKKKIKEVMKDYTSDKPKRRRTRDYQPLLSGNK